MWDLVLSAIGSFMGWIPWIVSRFVEFMLDLVRLEIGSWSPLELTATWVFFGIVSGFCCNTPLEVIILFFLVQPWNLV